jgi:mannitol-1-phosphate 5-dehydrogenase
LMVNNNKSMRTAVQFGAGNIGRGFMGQLLWEAGYSTVFVESYKPLVDALNRAGQYPLKLLDARSQREINLTIDRFRVVHADDSDAVSEALLGADLISTAVGLKNLPAIAPTLAEGVVKRYEAGAQPIDIYLCENVLNAADELRGHVKKLWGHVPEAGGQRNNAPILTYMEENVGFVGTVVARMVPNVGDRFAGEDPLLVVADSYHRFTFDGKAARAPMPAIEGMHPVSNFSAEVERKLFTYNMGHAALAYLGYLKGFTYVHEPFDDPYLMEIFQGALDETCDAVLAKYPDVFTPANQEEIRRDIDLRFGNPMIQDSVLRVGRDPIRKLGPDDRLIGSARLCLTQGIFPERVAQVCGAALLYDSADDSEAVRLQEMIKGGGVEKVLKDISGVDTDSDFGRRIISSYGELKNMSGRGIS